MRKLAKIVTLPARSALELRDTGEAVIRARQAFLKLKITIKASFTSTHTVLILKISGITCEAASSRGIACSTRILTLFTNVKQRISSISGITG